jgi:hypothetical protein
VLQCHVGASNMSIWVHLQMPIHAEVMHVESLKSCAMQCRAFLKSLTVAFPHVLVVGLVDWNPSGVAILSL